MAGVSSFTDANPSAASARVRRRALTPHLPNPHLRWHPLRAEWFAFAAHRQNRNVSVLPTAIPQRTRVHVTARPGRSVRASSAAFGSTACDYVVGNEARAGTWMDYVQGVTYALRAVAPRVSGFDVRVDSHVPLVMPVDSTPCAVENHLPPPHSWVSID